MFPLLALGIMGGLGLLNQRAYDDRKQAGADKVQSLLGSAPREMGPPTEDGTMGQVPGTGTGLLGNMSDPATQAQFMQGLLTLPKAQAAQASAMYGDLFQRLQQGQQFQQGERRQGSQFDRSQAQQAGQFDRSETRQAGQFAQDLGFRQGEAATGHQQWKQAFDASRNEFAQRMALERAGAAAKGAGAGADGVPKLPVGYIWTQTATGPAMMPAPGHADFAKVTDTESALSGAAGKIGRYLDIYAGKEAVSKDGKPLGVRIGGSGDQYMGSETGGTLSTIRAGIIADVAKLQDLGVLQPGDLKRLDAQLADPESLWGVTHPSRGRVVKGYEELKKQFEAKLTAHRQSNPWLLPPPPPGTVLDGAAPSPVAAPSSPSGRSGAGAAPPDQRRGLMFPAGEQ